MYTESSKYYDAIYTFKNYAQEARYLREIILNACPQATSILDVACGTHEHARFLAKWFEVDGVDVNSEFLTKAAAKNPSGKYVQKDMRELSLGPNYDAVLCLSSSIAYLRNAEEFKSVVSRFAAHLRPGGLVLIEPWYSQETWTDDWGALVVGELDGEMVARGSSRRREGDHSLLTFYYMIVGAGEVRTFKEDHHLLLLSRAEIVEAFENAGLRTRHDETWSRGRGLYIGRLTADNAGVDATTAPC